MSEPNGYIEGSNGERLELVDKVARTALKTKLPTPKTANVGDYLRISAINEDGSMLVEAVSAPGAALPTEATFAHITLETAQTADGECGVIIHPEGTEDVPELTFYGMRGDEAVRLNNVADAIDDRSVPNLGQVKNLVQKNGNDSGQNLTLDTTLTQSGQAADAKAVGDALDKVEKKIPSIEGLAKTEDIPTRPEDIGAQPVGDYLTKAPVVSVNGKAGAVVLSASDVGALPSTYTPPNQTAAQVGADPKGAAESKVSEHNADTAAHNDLRLEVKAIREQLAAFLDVDEETLNELSELIAAIAANQTSIEQLTSGKINVSDIVNNLVTNVTNKPLSAAQGVELKKLIDNVSASLANYQPKGDYLTEHQSLAHLLPRTELTNAINAALAQAKADGEFDGEDGEPGQRGLSLLSVTTAPSSYTTAVGGITPKYRMALSTMKTQAGVSEVLVGDIVRYSYYEYPVAYLDASYAYFTTRVSLRGTAGAAATFEITGATALAYGATPTVTEASDSTAQARKYVVGIPAGRPGEDGSPGTPGADGNDGYTPVRGVDYWTADDIAAINADITTELAKRGQLKPEFANSIEECTDTSKLYVLPDGMIYAYMQTLTEGGEPLFTNRADPTSADWQADKRFSSSSGSISACTGTIVSNAIATKKGDIIRVQGLRDGSTTATSSAYAGYMGYSDTAGTTKLWSTPLFFNKTKSQNTGGIKDIVSHEGDAVVTTAFLIVPGTGTGSEQRNGADSVVCIRVSGEPVTTVDDIIVTINEKIAYSEGSTGYAWRSTGHAFVPADYEDSIIELEETQAEHTVKIAALEKAVESGSTDETEAAALEKIKVWDKPVYDSAPLTLISDDRAKPALPESEKTVDAVYAKYRALMAKYPDYITETSLGLSSSSDTFAAVDILRFDFKERDGRVETGYVLNETKPKIIFMTGVHLEYAGIYGLYYALEEIAENPDFRDIRRNAHIIVIPCSNPHCLGGATKVEGWTMSHVNANGVAIHNNFGVDFGKGNATATLGAYNYGGTEPYSEVETQYVDRVMSENTDAIAFVSCHNFNYGVKFAADFVWMSSATAHMCNLAFRLIDKLTTAWMDKYGEAYTTNFDAYRDMGTETYADGDYRIGRATFSTSGGTEAKNATKYGVLGTNLEIGDRMRVVSGDTTYTSAVLTHGAEVYANFIRTLLWNYNHGDRKEYAPNLPWKD